MKLDRELKTNLKTLQFELLVPVNNKETAKKAVLSGADAIYAGYSKFGARVNAGNSLADLIEIIEFAHIFNVRVYITLNTIFNDSELFEVEKLIKKLYLIKTDGIIIQDMGVLELDIPPIPLIASTQCNNTSIEKINFFEKTGFKRVILPREMSLAEIQNIRKNTNIELECFIHGALCMSYSGQCYMSYVNGKRSANRGECAQPCRKKYSLKDCNGKYIVRNKHILSLKDLNLSEHLESLILSGVNSFKIEGRLKNDNYVVNTTMYYRKKIDAILEYYNLNRSSDGVSKTDFEPDLYKTFNRGFTNFNFTGKRNDTATVNYTSSLGEFIGVVIDTKKNYFKLNNNILTNGDGICFFDEYKQLIGTNINKVDGEFIYPSEIKGIKEGVKIYRNFDKNFDNKLKNSDLKRQINVYLKIKETNTGFWFFLSDKQNNTVVYGLNKNFEIAKNKENMINILKIQLEKSGNSEYQIQVKNIKLKTIPYIKISIINEIRRILVNKLKRIRKKSYINEYGINKKEIASYPYCELDYRANILNKKAEMFYKKRSVHIKEYALESQKNYNGKKVVMISKYCLKNQFGLCPREYKNKKQYKEPFTITDEFNKEYPVEFDCANCIMKIIKVYN